MQKTLAITLALCTLGFVAPVASAETVTQAYTGALGASVLGTGAALVLFPNSEDSPYTQAGINPIGGVRLNAEGTYTNVVVGVSDDGFWGSNGGISTCFWNPEGDNTCDGDDYGSDAACGGVSLTGSPFASDFVTVWAYTIIVNEDATVCGTTFGTVSGDFF